MLQEVIITDAGGTTTSTTSVNVNGANVSITPKSITSKLIISVVAQFGEGAVSAATTAGTFQLFDVTNSVLVGIPIVAQCTGSTNVGVFIPGAMAAIVTNAALTSRSFQMQAKTNNASAIAQAASMVWSIREIQN